MYVYVCNKKFLIRPDRPAIYMITFNYAILMNNYKRIYFALVAYVFIV